MEEDSDTPPGMYEIFEEKFPNEETHNEINQTFSDSDSVYRDCEICFTNQILKKGKNRGTVVFKCGHRFCRECSVDHFAQSIRQNKIDKFLCPQEGCKNNKVSIKTVRRVIRHDEALVAKYKEFRSNQADMMTRFCVKPGCGARIQGKSLQDTKLNCPTCKTAICFQCREAWHGSTSCEKAFREKVGG